MSQVYRSGRHWAPSHMRPRRVTASAARPRAYISHRGISSLIVVFGALAILDGALFVLIGLR